MQRKDIIQEAKELLAELEPNQHIDGHMTAKRCYDIVSRLVDRLEWKLIESAPKDGTEILLLNKETGERKSAAWHNFYKEWSSGYVSVGYEGGTISFENPTHWLPLPPAGDK